MAYGTEPADKAQAVTTSDTAHFTENPRSLYIGGGGDLKVKTADGGTVTFIGVKGGSVLPVSVSLVFATGTTATSIVALW